MKKQHKETLEINVDRFVENKRTGELYPIIFQDDEQLIIFHPDGSTSRVSKEYLRNEK